MGGIFGRDAGMMLSSDGVFFKFFLDREAWSGHGERAYYGGKFLAVGPVCCLIVHRFISENILEVTLLILKLNSDNTAPTSFSYSETF